MDEKKQRLLELIKLLKFSLSPEEFKKQMEMLSEEELDSLIKIYSSIYEYQNLLDDIARSANPEEYKRLKDEYNKDILNAELEYTNKLESAQVLTDEGQDLLDDEADRESEALSSDIKKKFQEIEDTSDDLSLGLKPLPSENSHT